jgi:MFS transporter, SET family, sugar efflux transporter
MVQITEMNLRLGFAHGRLRALSNLETGMTFARPPVTALIGTSLFFTGISFAATLPYRGIVAVDGLWISNGTFALLMTLGSIAVAGASLALGYLADKVPDRRLLVIFCAMLGAIAHGLIYLFNTPLAYIVSYCVIMPFGGALFSQSFSFSRAFYDVHHPGRAEFMMSVLRTVFALAWVVFPPVAGWIASTYTVFDVFGVAAAAHVVCMLIFASMLGDDRTRIGTSRNDGGGAAQESDSRIDPTRVIGIGGVTLVKVAMALSVITIPLALVRDLGGTLTDVGIYASLAAALEVPCMLFWGFAAARISKEVILVINGAIYGLFLLLMFSAETVSDALWLLGLNAISTAALLSITISYMQEAIKGRVGLSTSLMDLVTVVSTLLASAVFAALADRDSYSFVFLAAGIVSLGGAGVILITLKPRLRRTVQERR